MREFTALVAHLRALQGHPPAQALAWQQWQAAPPPGADLATTQRLFAGKPPASGITAQRVRRLLSGPPAALAGLLPEALRTWPEGLLQACLHATGDALEALCLALPEPVQAAPMPLRQWCDDLLPQWAALPDAEERVRRLLIALHALPSEQRLLAADLATGRFRNPLVPVAPPPNPEAACHRLAALCTYLRPAPGGVQVALALWRGAPPSPEQWQAALAGQGLAAPVGPWITLGQLLLRADTAEEQAIAQALGSAGTHRAGAVQALDSAVVVWLRHEGAVPSARRKCGWELRGLRWDGLADADLATVGRLAELANQSPA